MIKHAKVVVIILLVSVVLVTIAFFTLVACYVYRRQKCPIPPSVFSSDRESSYNSATWFIGHRIMSETESAVKPVAGKRLIQLVAFLYNLSLLLHENLF